MDYEETQQLPNIGFIALYVVSGLFEAKNGDDNDLFLLNTDYRFPTLIEYIF